VTWPHGVDGIGPPLLQLCNVAQNWHEFAQKTIALLSPGNEIGLTPADRVSITRELQANVVYGELGAWLDSRPPSSD
jgi:hypothetical protein